MKTRSILLVLIVPMMLLAACGGSAKVENTIPKKTYEFKGTIVSIDRAAKTARIDHSEVPGLMPGMTMDFPIHEDWVWKELVPGAVITAELIEDKQGKEPYYLEKIVIISAPVPGQSAPPEKTPEQIGKVVPDGKLVGQDGKPFKFTSLAGKAYAVTFIYSDCPLPEFCIKMSKQFSDMAKQILADPAMKDSVRLVSVSFDPERDTPEKLEKYGLGYLGDAGTDGFKIWTLVTGPDAEIKAVADFFGLMYEKDAQNNDVFNHSLVTAVVGKDGKVKKVYSGGRWMPDEILNDLKTAAAS